MCSRVPISYTLTGWKNSKFKGKENQTQRKKPHGRTHTTDANTSPASTTVTRDTTELIKRSICTYHRVVRSAQGIVLAISGSATRLVRRIPCQLVAKAGHHLASGSSAWPSWALPASNESDISAAVGIPKSGKGRMSFDIPLPLEAAVPLNELYHRRCWIAPRGKKMCFQGEADFCRKHPAQIWWTVIRGPGSLLVLHCLVKRWDP